MHVFCRNTIKNSYNIEKSQVLNFTKVHTNDVNSVCWDNRKTSHILYTGSDDCTILVWDRRILGEKQKPAGVLIGHQEGITHVCSKGDSYHLISNGKDQLLKYWDIRKMNSLADMRNMPPLKRVRGFDYRFTKYPAAGKQVKHKLDSSIMDLKGHSVLATLIRCYFSPIETTNQRYIYSGSAMGEVFIYDTLNPDKPKRLPVLDENNEIDENQQILPIRDVSWHPKYPFLAATSFSGNIYTWNYKFQKDFN